MQLHNSSPATAELVLRAQDGDARALDRLLEDHYPTLSRLALSLIKDRDAAEDVVQDTLIRLAQKLEQLVKPAEFLRWAQTILRREAFEFFRKQKRAQSRFVSLDASGAEPVVADPGRPFVSTEDIEEGLRRLQTGDRNLLKLHYWGGLEVREIAERLGIAVGAVKTRLFRARNRLRELLCEPELNWASRLEG